MSCNRNRRIILSTAVAIVGGNMQITIPNQTLFNREIINLIIAQTIPVSANPIPVTVLVNGVSIPLYNKCGNKVYSDQIRPRNRYQLLIATDVPLMIKIGGCHLRCTAKTFPVLNPTTVVGGSVASDINSDADDFFNALTILEKKGE